MAKDMISADELTEWLEDKYFECKDEAVNHAVDEIIEKVRLMIYEEPKKKDRTDYFADFRDSLLEEEWNE